MNCPRCNSLNIVKNGLTRFGKQMYQCTDCRRRFTGGKDGRPRGDKSPMSDAERARRYRERKKSQGN